MAERRDVLIAATLAEAEQYQRDHPEAREWFTLSVLSGRGKWATARRVVRHCYLTPAALASERGPRAEAVMDVAIRKAEQGGRIIELGADDTPA